EKQRVFHKFSIFVWCIWLIPYVIGAIIGMSH
ncbi:TIGR03987 family protein, partial [Lawsonibacter sp. DFI.6.74]|nr:TIGR03987 family protein [Lawsonibacter sp. DFI.6.74]